MALGWDTARWGGGGGGGKNRARGRRGGGHEEVVVNKHIVGIQSNAKEMLRNSDSQR